MKRLLLLWVVVPALAGAQVAEGEPERFGAVAPAALPDGSTAFSGWVGVPELGAGFRQGIEGWELGARARVDYLRLAAVLEATGRRQVWTHGALALAPELGLGLTLDSGSRHVDDAGFPGVFLRVNPGVVATWRALERLSTVGLVEVPVDLGLNPAGFWRMKALGGGGAEVSLGEDLSLLAVGLVGLEAFRTEADGVRARLGYGVRLGLGVRLF
jgi:hypothetical protein